MRCLAVGLVVSLMACGPAQDAPDRDDPAQVAEQSPGSGSAIAPEWCQALPRAAYAGLTEVPTVSDWFEVYEVGEGVLAIYEPNQWQEIISYLVLGSDMALLFDTGMGIESISEVVGELTDLPVLVLNSHTHMDHIGGNAEFRTVIAMDTEYTRERSLGLSNERVREEVRPEALCAPLPAGVTEDNYHTRPFDVSAYVADGHRISLGDRRLELMHIPGHTPDAVALFEEASGYLFTGDSFYEGPIWLFAAETDLTAYEASVEKLADLVPQLTRVFPAHNTPVADPVRLVELRDALASLRSGTLEGTAGEDGLMRYEVSTFSLLMRAAGGQ